MTNQEAVNKLNKQEIKNFTDADYQDYYTYPTMEEVIIIVGRMSGQGTRTNPVLPYKTTFNHYIYFQTPDTGILVDLRAKQLDNGGFVIQELTMKAYNAMERRISEALSA